MKTLNILFLLYLLIIFMTGMYVYMFNGVSSLKKEGLANQTQDSTNPDDENSCPDILINKGNSLLLYNSKMKEIDGINPIPFSNLDEYINYLEIQRNKGIRCPVLYLQQENNAQGNDIYRIRPSPFDPQGGLPTPNLINDSLPTSTQQVMDATRDNPPYNIGNYPGFDPYGLHVGQYTTIDQVHDSTGVGQISDNPSDPNWGGVLYTESAVKSGKYDENTVYRPQLVTVKNVVEYPQLYNSR